jgi:lipoate-protein ligase A
MTPNIRLLPLGSLDGPTNMAADEAMLETASERGIASLRFYTWTEPTLTLGYFQPAAAREQHPNLSSLPWVRRSTGGAGIVHHRELTYAFALPPGAEWKSAESWICLFHHLVQSVLGDVGVASRLVVCGEEQKLGEVLCFLHQTPGDMLLNGSKVAGSAQRKLRGAILQHGSLLLRRSEFAPMLPGMEDLVGRDLFTPQELAERLAARFAKDAAATIEPGDWSAKERDRIPEIVAQKYANLEWNAKR